jgi:hypothetical protein
MTLPDRQTVYYEALIEAAAEQLDAETFDYACACEPESHDFGPDDGGYDDPDEYRETIMEIGARDLEDKIGYWEDAIQNGYVTGGIDPIQRAEMRAGA